MLRMQDMVQVIGFNFIAHNVGRLKENLTHDGSGKLGFVAGLAKTNIRFIKIGKKKI